MSNGDAGKWHPGTRAARVQAVACGLLLVVLRSLVPVAPVPAEHHGALAVHAAPCPDQSPEGDPCDEGCQCLCCPGHARVIPGAMMHLASFGHARELPGAVDAVNPFDFVWRVYRPPIPIRV